MKSPTQKKVRKVNPRVIIELKNGNKFIAEGSEEVLGRFIDLIAQGLRLSLNTK